MDFRSLKLFICLEMGWTEEEFLSQRWDFINELLIFIEERNKKTNDQH